MDLSAPTDSAGAGTSQATIKQLEVPTNTLQMHPGIHAEHIKHICKTNKGNGTRCTIA